MRVIRAIGKAGATAIVTATLLASAKPEAAVRLRTDTTALFPKNIGEFAYCDLKKARSEKCFAQLREQMIPERFRQFEKFLASAGVDPNSEVDELAWGLVGEGLDTKTQGPGSSAVPSGDQIVGVAPGTSNPNSIQPHFKRQKVPTF